MNKRLQKIDEFLDSLESTGLTKGQTSLILTAQNGDTSAGANLNKCANTSPDRCSDNELSCKNGGSNCAGATNKDSCANVTMDSLTQCVTPPPTGDNGVCPVLSNSFLCG